MLRHSLACLLLLSGACFFSADAISADGPPAAVVTFDASGERTLLVADPAATQKKALAVDVGSGISGSHKLKTSAARLEAGIYRATLYARLHGGENDDLSRMRFDWIIGGVQGGTVKKSFIWTQLDSTPDRYTPIVLQTTLLVSGSPTIQLDWSQVATGAADKVQSIRKQELPTSPDTVAVLPKKPKSLAGGDDLLSEIKAESAPLTPLSSFTYPALLLDHVQFERVTSAAAFVEKVHPQFVHVYPNQANPIDVKIRNLGAQPMSVDVRLELLAGLDEVVHTAAQTVALKPNGLTDCRFEWPGGPREFGHEARVTLLLDGKPLHTASEYFSCSFPIWKTAMQASGFLDFHDRLEQMDDHVASNRSKYLNVEEAFSWQPSSWTDLNPKNDHWWTGQGDAHNSRAGLEKWIGLSHAEGIKMITYLWPTASGPEAIEWGRETPELITHTGVGLPTEFFDVEDLRLKSITEADPKLWNLRSGIWNYLGINNGLLRSMDEGIDETIRSAKTFGWDGARFDKPPGWSAMGAADVHQEFKLLGVESLMQKLLPEYYEQKEGQWTGEAVSLGNVRYARHRLREHDPNFALSFNFGVPQNAAAPGSNKFFEECSLDGGQIMDEQIRQVVRGPWHDYMTRIRTQANIVRERGGFHCCVVASGMSASMRLYMACCLFIGGSHPYGDYGWNAPMPGNYAQFITRYGEYCWAADLKPTTAEAEQFSIDDDKTLWWRELPRRRTLADGRTQWVVHVLSNPPSEEMAPVKQGQMTPWRNNIVVGRKTVSEPIVWAMTAEPTTRSKKLPTKKVGDRYVVEIPEHHVWTMLVWTEAAR